MCLGGPLEWGPGQVASFASPSQHTPWCQEVRNPHPAYPGKYLEAWTTPHVHLLRMPTTLLC